MHLQTQDYPVRVARFRFWGVLPEGALMDLRRRSIRYIQEISSISASVVLTPILTTFTVGGPNGGVFDLVLMPLLDVDFSVSNPITSIVENGVSDVLVQCNVAVVGCSCICRCR